MLDKYSADPEKLANLLSIPQYFDLDLYTSGRQEASLQALLVKLKYIVQVQHEPEVSENIKIIIASYEGLLFYFFICIFR